MGINISQRVSVVIKKIYYTHERYQINATFAMLYHEKPLSVIELAEHVRISDQLIQIDDNHYFIIFDFTTQKNSYKAAQNIIQNLDIHFNDHTSCIALDTFNHLKSPQSVLNRLNMILTEIRKKNYIRIEIEDILDH